MWLTISAIFLVWVCVVGFLLWLRKGILTDKRTDEREEQRGSLSVAASPRGNYCPNPDCNNFMITLALANYCNKCGTALPTKTDPSVKELQELADEFDASMVGGICSEMDHGLKLDRAPVIDGKQTAYCTRCGKKLESIVPPRA